MKFVATFWRSNPQLKNGGYWTEREIEARTLREARNQARRIENSVAYGSMTLRGIERKED